MTIAHLLSNIYCFVIHKQKGQQVAVPGFKVMPLAQILVFSLLCHSNAISVTETPFGE